MLLLTAKPLCVQMSIFLVSALNSLGMGATLVALSVIALDAWSRGGVLSKAYAPAVHAGAALLVSLFPGEGQQVSTHTCGSIQPRQVTHRGSQYHGDVRLKNMVVQMTPAEPFYVAQQLAVPRWKPASPAGAASATLSALFTQS